MPVSTFSKSIDERQLPERKLTPSLTDPTLYRPSPELWNAVAVALEMNLPLLLTGEPGTGKTQLAHYIAWYFGLGKPLVFDAQTTSSVRDLFYHYDALSHFQYAQTKGAPLTVEQVEERYISYKALGKAIRDKKQFVVLIDEIDKAPRDLPNNVLSAIEEMRFRVPEIDQFFQLEETAPRPIIILTSNSEKNLPEAFLRRVAYYNIPFPGREELLEILKHKIPSLNKMSLSSIVSHFEDIRNGRWGKLERRPATAELIHWTMLLQKMDFPVDRLGKLDDLDKNKKEQLFISYSVLAKNEIDHTLLKNALGL